MLAAICGDTHALMSPTWHQAVQQSQQLLLAFVLKL